MFFLIRCIFWLGLVFCHIAGLHTVNPAEIAGKAGVVASNLASGLAHDGAAAAQAQINAAQAQCLAKPEECLANIDKLSRLAQAAGVGAAAHANAADMTARSQFRAVAILCWPVTAPRRAPRLAKSPATSDVVACDKDARQAPLN